MRRFLIISALVLTSWGAACQTEFEISGTVNGHYKDSIYLFFENDFQRKDSLNARIENGKFSFKLKAALPILCRIHFSSSTNIEEFYADGLKTELWINSKLIRENDELRSEFQITDIKGSKMEDDKREYYARLKEYAKPSTEYTTEDVAYPLLSGYVRSNPNSKLSAYLIAGRIYMLGNAFMVTGQPPFNYTWTMRLSSYLDSSVMNSFEGQNLRLLQGYLAKAANRDTGKIFFDVVLKDPAGENVSTSVLRGKYVLVDFWASWCGPCRALNPDLKKLYSQYQKKGFEILGISLDDDIEAWKKALAHDQLPWIQLRDPVAFNGPIARNYHIKGIPTKILVDPSGKVIHFNPSLYDVEKLLASLK